MAEPIPIPESQPLLSIDAMHGPMAANDALGIAEGSGGAIAIIRDQGPLPRIFT